MFTWRSRPHRDMTENISYMMSDADMRPPGDTLYVTGALIPLSRSEACTVIRFVNYKKHSFKKSTSYWYLILSDRWLQKQIHFRLKMIPGVPPLCAPTVCPLQKGNKQTAYIVHSFLNWCIISIMIKLCALVISIDNGNLDIGEYCMPCCIRRTSILKSIEWYKVRSLLFK